MRMLELQEMLRAQLVAHGDCPVVLGVQVEGNMTVDHIEAIGSVTNEYGEIAVCLATKPLLSCVNGEPEIAALPDLPHANGEMLTDL